MKDVHSVHDLIFDRDAARAVDREAMARYGMPSLLLMENAAIALREAALGMLGSEAAPPTRHREEALALILCGSGNNGGDGYALARHLHNARCSVEILALGEPRDGTDARINADICKNMNLRIVSGRDEIQMNAREVGLIVDAIFGTGLDRPVEGDAREIIAWINSLGKPVLAADIPSGLDCDTGQPLGIAVRATRTVSFVGIKKGFFVNKDSRRYTGEVIIGDIGVPRELLNQFGTRM